MNQYFIDLTNKLLVNDPETIEFSIKFIEADSKQAGYGRVRALMCRRLKHCTLSQAQRDRLVKHILERLKSGNFAQQFKDELRLALFLNKKRSFEAALSSSKDCRDHVRRYAQWILEKHTFDTEPDGK
ncbi:hypothetical protein [Gloeothece verrucosa]|uniref:Uncharacterized protein n=1 Tax=Gloeothece verrucosa (strain PCC 7822) TaxID=497965 RepID=E0ULG0_GLOV7|nr:hypothetical protein [Gloeothece verrucosa]ADN17790.1 conserved hypothetical protein [Gloeothece verrucosa PCC 7822]